MKTGLFFGYFTWWYSEGAKKIIKFLSASFDYLSNFYSVRDVLKTFFKPWRRLVGARRPGLDGLRDWVLDNFVSRLVGVAMRTGLMFFYLCSVSLFFAFSLVVVTLWYGAPFVSVGIVYVVLGGFGG